MPLGGFIPVTVYAFETRRRYQSPTRTTVMRIAVLNGLAAVAAYAFETGGRIRKR